MEALRVQVRTFVLATGCGCILFAAVSYVSICPSHPTPGFTNVPFIKPSRIHIRFTLRTPLERVTSPRECSLPHHIQPPPNAPQ